MNRRALLAEFIGTAFLLIGVIGSGIMESTCKQLVGQRLKGSGRQWSERGALAMTALIGQRINRSWEAFWASRPIHRAA